MKPMTSIPLWCSAGLLTLLWPVLRGALPGDSAWVRAQVEIMGRTAQSGDPSFAVDAVSFEGQDSLASRLDVLVRVGYDMLSFVKHDDRFEASYEITVDLYDSTKAMISEKVWTEEVGAAPFEETVGTQASKLSERVFDVPPGRYSLVVLFRDSESRDVRRAQGEIRVHDFTRRSFCLSDVMLLRKLTITGTKRLMEPNVFNNVWSVPDAFYAFFETYNNENIDSVRFVATVVDAKEKSRIVKDTVEAVGPGRNSNFVRISHGTLPLGSYTLAIRAFPVQETKRDPGAELGATAREFIVQWYGVPNNETDLDKAVAQLEYIAEGDEASHIKDATTLEEKQNRFRAFWKKRDPNPNTPRNEKMEAYYARVDYATRHFSYFREGWRTDRGMIYVIFGPPDDVERHPFDSESRPFETWTYFRLNFEFLFIDDTGLGDFRLMTPQWVVDDLRRRD